MKAMHKQLWGYLLITLSLAGFTPLQAQTDSADEGGYIGQYDRHGHERRR